MTGAQLSLLRFGICCAAWAGAQTLAWQLGMRAPVREVLEISAAAAAYLLTSDLGTYHGRGGGGGNVRYWRGRKLN